MVPTVTQQLEAMRRRFAETIIPALPQDADFAQEQAKLMLATFDWLLDTHEHQYRYVVVENNLYRRLLAELAALGGRGLPEPLCADVRACLAEPGPAAEEASTPLPRLEDQNRRIKQLAMTMAGALQDGADAGAARALVAECAHAQGKRELAFFRKTGFPGDEHDLLSELDPVTSTAKADCAVRHQSDHGHGGIGGTQGKL